jgi:hypothetical protein
MTSVYIEDHNLVIEWNNLFKKIPMIKKEFSYEVPKVDIEAEIEKLKMVEELPEL